MRGLAYIRHALLEATKACRKTIMYSTRNNEGVVKNSSAATSKYQTTVDNRRQQRIMVQGLGFLSKKSWHTKNKANQEKVWIAEEQKKAEEAKTKELARQIQQEREEEEFEKISGKKTSIKDRGIDWMYQGATTGELATQEAEKKQEEYLLGKEFVEDGAVKGDFDDGQKQPDGIHNVISKAAAASASTRPKNDDYYGPASTGQSLSNTTNFSNPESTVASRNEEFRMRMEDPMFLVSQKQREKQVKHDKAKALYEKVVGPSCHTGHDDDNSSKESSYDRQRDPKRSKKSKKEHKRHKKHKKENKSSKRRHDRHRYIDDNDSDDGRDYDSEYEEKAGRRRKRRSPSRSRSRSRSWSRSPSPEYKAAHKKRKSDDDYDDDHKKHRDHRGWSNEGEYRSCDYHHRDRHHKDADRKHSHYDDRHKDQVSRRKDQHDEQHNNDDRLKDPPSYSQAAGADGPKKIEGYGLKGAASFSGPRSIDHSDLGPSRELLQRRREERERERRRIRETASTRKRASQKDRERALEEMQDDARKRESRMDRHARYQREDTEEDEFGRRAANRGKASFLDDIHKQSHGISTEGSASLSSRVAQNRHTQQRLNDSFF